MNLLRKSCHSLNENFRSVGSLLLRLFHICLFLRFNPRIYVVLSGENTCAHSEVRNFFFTNHCVNRVMMNTEVFSSFLHGHCVARHFYTSYATVLLFSCNFSSKKVHLHHHLGAQKFVGLSQGWVLCDPFLCWHSR